MSSFMVVFDMKGNNFIAFDFDDISRVTNRDGDETTLGIDGEVAGIKGEGMARNWQ